MTKSHIVVTYCESWDPARKQADCPISAAVARARYAAGEPFAAVLSHAGEARVFLRVDRARGWIATDFLDDVGRRVVEIVYRDLGDRLHLSLFRMRSHGSDDEPESEAGMVTTFDVAVDGKAKAAVDAGGGRFVTWAEVPAEAYRVPRLEFGAWPVDGRLIGADEVSGFVDARDPDGHADHDSGCCVPAFPWKAPAPLSPNHLEALFTAGARFQHPRWGGIEIRQPVAAGLLNLPSGRVVVTDPGTFHRAEPYTVSVPPGRYPVLVAEMSWDDMPWGSTPAAMVRISDKPTATWELALQPGQDERTLGDGEFYGFGVDTGMGAFLDAAGAGALKPIYAEAVTAHGPGLDGASVQDPETGANLISFASGEGDGEYPVWIGRDQDGDVTCFVADTCVVGPSELLTPGGAELRHVPGRVVPAAAPDADADAAKLSASPLAPVPAAFDSGPITGFFLPEAIKVGLSSMSVGKG